MGFKRYEGVYAAVSAVVGGDFVVEVELSVGGCIVGFLEYCYRCIVAVIDLSERLISSHNVNLFRVYHEVSMARVKRLRQLCARLAARAGESAERCGHLERNTSIRQ